MKHSILFRQVIPAALILALLLPAAAWAQFLPPGQADFLNEYGVRIDKDLTGVPEGKSIMGVVSDPGKLAGHGFAGAKKGDKLLLLNIGGGSWKLKLMSTGREKQFKMKK